MGAVHRVVLLWSIKKKAAVKSLWALGRHTR